MAWLVVSPALGLEIGHLKQSSALFLWVLFSFCGSDGVFYHTVKVNAASKRTT